MGNGQVTVYEVVVLDKTGLGGPMGSDSSSHVIASKLLKDRKTALAWARQYLRDHYPMYLNMRGYTQTKWEDLGPIGITISQRKVE